jgi:hypothetical protein
VTTNGKGQGSAAAKAQEPISNITEGVCTPIRGQVQALEGVDKEEAERFLSLLDPDAEFYTFQTCDDNAKRKDPKLARIFHGTLDQHWNKLKSLNGRGAGVFVCINATNGKGRTAEDVTRVRALFLDLDGAPLKPVHQAKPAPHIIVESSRGHYHAYWRVTGVSLDDFTSMQKALAARFNGDPNVCDLPRVMRLPGFFHRKGEPFLTRILHTNECEPHTADDLAQLIPAVKANGKNHFEAYEPNRASPLERLNTAALANMAAWVLEIFPDAQTTRRGGYRVSSAMLGRDLEEDLSLHPEGIKDFGIHDMGDRREGRRTPIDIVVEYGKKTHEEAVAWLRERLGMPEDVAQRRAEQIAENIKIGDDVAEPMLPQIMTLEEMHKRLMFIGSSGIVADLVTGRVRKKEHATDEYAASVHTYKHTQGNSTQERKGPALRFWISSKDRMTVETLAWVPGKPQICQPPEGPGPAFNTWKGLPPMAFPEDWQGRVKPFLGHVAFLVPIDEERERFLNWLAHIVQRPEVLPHTCYLMITETTGIGRNLLASVIVRALRGFVAAGVSLPELLDGGFTGRLSKKLLGIVDEAKEGSGERRYQRANLFRQIVTEEHRLINPKYGHQSVEKNCCRWLTFSNHHDALPFDNSDRRIVVIANPTIRKEETYYAQLYSLLDDRAFIGSVRRWLETKDISSFRPGAHAPMNEAKLQALDEMMTETERAVHEFKEDCTTELTSRDAIKDYVTENGRLHVNDAHLTHAIRRAGMIHTGKRVNFNIKTAGGGTVQRKLSVVIVRGDWTTKAVKNASNSVLLAAMGYQQGAP